MNKNAVNSQLIDISSMETSSAERHALGNRICEARKQLGYTQEKFAEIFGISLTAYKKWENAEHQISLDGLRILHKKFHISIDYLLFGEKKTFERVWEDVQNSSEEDKMRLVMQLIIYFCKIKGEKYISNEMLSKIDKYI